MKVIFCLTSGRTGTKYLFYIFKNNVENCISVHHQSSPNMFGKAIYWHQIGEIEKLKKLFNKKQKKIQNYNADAYTEINHAFLKSFYDVAIEAFADMKLIHLIRNPLKVARSNLNRYKTIKKMHVPCTYKGNNGKRYFKWALTGQEEIFTNFGFDENTIFELSDEIKVYQFFLLQWIEIENRAMAFLDRYNKHNDCYTLETPKDLNDSAVLNDMFKFFDLKLKQKDILFRGRKNRNIKPTVITEDEKDKLKEIVSKIDDQYLKIFRNKPYTNFEWIKILS
ncbi:MAG: hypothetical protein ACXAC5_23870 [Promethearchaeota archaeon]|jgi:hypothetical protein